MDWASLLPLGASSFTVAVVCYPVDVLRALKMSGAGGQASRLASSTPSMACADSSGRGWRPR